MKLCDINNLLIFLIIIFLAYMVYNISVDKKNIETFTNSGWKLNSDGELCHSSQGCHDIASVSDDNRICDMDGSNCVDITTDDVQEEEQKQGQDPVNCVEGTGVELGSCVVAGSCGSGTQTRERTGDVGPSNGGSACSSTSQTQDCNVECPVVNCVEGTGVELGSCVVAGSCGSGTQTRERTGDVGPSNGGSACGSNIEQQDCNVECPEPVGVWGSTWGSCSEPCGSGVQTQDCIEPGSCTGSAPSQPCNLGSCS